MKKLVIVLSSLILVLLFAVSFTQQSCAGYKDSCYSDAVSPTPTVSDIPTQQPSDCWNGEIPIACVTATPTPSLTTSVSPSPTPTQTPTPGPTVTSTPGPTATPGPAISSSVAAAPSAAPATGRAE